MDSAPNDLIFYCIVLGCGTLLPWNAFLSNLDYIGMLYPSCKLDYLTAANFAGNLLFLIVQLQWTGNRHSKALIGITIHLIVVAYILFIVFHVKDISAPDWKASEQASFSALIVGMTLSGGACASLQGSLFSIAGQHEGGGKLCGCLMTGAALAGVLACAFSIGSKELYSTTPAATDSLRRGALISLGC
eukprot:CAMPEP_0113665562 /NCGR_PEP_ID=MMETSP0038_2-20120614/2374_1 /TAXON_ID=2898 /ORGANISM="Cryptomonas paramecium" /LENGTH=188 /DNA_ID=CAMNT_0000580929 /DNA_START=22 /DNA_END=585 /DNA_ORIENTATION=+ /assembly_acc=CAM_ASM_000170